MAQNGSSSSRESSYQISHQDDYSHETDLLGKTFPHRLVSKTGKPDADYFEAFTATPFAVSYQLEMAFQAIENESLGKDDVPDMLGISITSTDIAGHAFGPDSHEVQDLIVQTDWALGQFLSKVKSRIGDENVSFVFTADHGAAPMPEYMASMGFDAGRITKTELSSAVEKALKSKYGEGEWILAMEDPAITLNRELIASKGLNRAEVEKVAGEAALTVKGVSSYYTRAQIIGGQLPNDRIARAFEKSFYPEISGDVLVATKPFYFWGKYGNAPEGSTHGSPYNYDTHVPLIFVGQGFKPGTYYQDVEIIDLAPTLASSLGISAPAGSEGKTISNILR